MTSPSNTIPLGSAVLRAMGDIKGAAKAMASEAKAAKQEATSANNELKAAQRETKLAERAAKDADRELQKTKKEAEKAAQAIERLKGSTKPADKQKFKESKELLEDINRRQEEAQKKVIASTQAIVEAKATEDARRREAEKRQDAASRKLLASNMEKERLKQERERLKDLNVFERRINDKLFGVKDRLQSVSRSLQSTGNPALQSIGRSIGSAASSITPEGTQGLVRAGGIALRGLRFAKVAGGAVGTGLAVTEFTRRVIRRNIESDIIKGQTQDLIRETFAKAAGRSVELLDLQERIARQEDIAKTQISRSSFLAGIFGTDGKIAETLGIGKDVAKREKQLIENTTKDALFSERFGAQFADRLDVDKIAQDPSFQKSVELKTRRDEGVPMFVLRQASKRGAGAFADSFAALGQQYLGISSGTKKSIEKFGDYLAKLPLTQATKLFGDKLFDAVDEAKLQEEAEKQRQAIRDQAMAQIAADQKRVKEDAINASVRKQNAIRDRSLEAERIRRSGREVARF